MIISVKTVTAAVILASPLFVTQSDPEPVVFMATSGSHRFTSPEQSRDVWQACGAKAPNGKLVRTFTRKEFRPAPRGTRSKLLCGSAKWGYRHIKDRHRDDWQAVANYLGQDWRSFADWAIEQTLKAPDSAPAYRQNNDTYAYRTPIQIRDEKNKVRARYRPVVVIAAKTKNIITAYPVAQR
ncbi:MULTISPECIES: hypothetical protein [Nonomuraea]|uniref:EndoU nuclease-like protein n=1 Tax=Nonomuraea ferruginea TaxID=46174 RepID=A0ABT4SQ16_9ACTN|nr:MULTISPECIES: hypothetical protein [Nonomuraea]MDA0639262.1 hypothetical protein [Nonomuraea ferruginea]TXK35415.1 hypothetical protein FR742_40005 [Nonomuraea sp. C10]